MAIETKQLLNLSQIYRDRIAKESVLQEKKAAKDYDGDGKVESGKDEYFGSKDKAIKKAMGKSPVAIEKKERKKDELFGAPNVKKEDAQYGYDKKGNSLNPVDIEKKKRKDDKLFGAPKTKKESFSNWRRDLQEVPDYEQIPISAKDRNKKIEEKNVKNTIKINPEMKEELEIIEAYADELNEADMIFITAGMGGGTGTGAAPAIAKIAREIGALTVGIVTKPFAFEGPIRKKRALDGIKEMKKNCDTLLVIPNETLLEISSEDTTVTESFKLADSILNQATKGISDLIN